MSFLAGSPERVNAHGCQLFAVIIREHLGLDRRLRVPNIFQCALTRSREQKCGTWCGRNTPDHYMTQCLTKFGGLLGECFLAAEETQALADLDRQTFGADHADAAAETVQNFAESLEPAFFSALIPTVVAEGGYDALCCSQ